MLLGLASRGLGPVDLLTHGKDLGGQNRHASHQQLHVVDLHWGAAIGFVFLRLNKGGILEILGCRILMFMWSANPNVAAPLS